MFQALRCDGMKGGGFIIDLFERRLALVAEENLRRVRALQGD